MNVLEEKNWVEEVRLGLTGVVAWSEEKDLKTLILVLELIMETHFGLLNNNIAFPKNVLSFFILFSISIPYPVLSCYGCTMVMGANKR